MERNEIWEMQWYPDSPVSSFHIAASSLTLLLRFANALNG